MSQDDNNTILNVTGLKTHFPVRGGWFAKQYVRAVDGVDLTVQRGQTLGLVGESGSGKTTVGRSILRLIPTSAGRVVFDGHDVFNLSRSALRNLRRRMTIIFQDPFGSLNPRMTVEDIVSEPIKVHGLASRKDRRMCVGQLLERVGLSPIYARRYPHEFSGGQRQRIGIARALASVPDFIVCDEPVSALDVSIQAQILNLLNDLQKELGLSYLFIAHNLAVVEHFADEVAVMYLGRIVERAPRDALYDKPMHPYTISLLSSVPRLKPDRTRPRIRLRGEVPSPISPPPGCPFHPRCPLTRKIARTLPPSATTRLLTGDEEVRVVTRCMCERPTLIPSESDPQHLHACLLRQSEA